MTLTIRKFIVIALITAVFLMANVVVVANWLAAKGVDQKANYLKENFLTGTAITVIVALLILLVAPKNYGKTFSFSRSCPVCDKRLFGNSNYCSECGSKV
jgi:hydrogenase-4 membrane subunit HyfE